MKIPFLKKKDKDASPQEKPVPRSNFLHEVRRDPFLDWALILGVSFIFAIGLVGVGISVYLEVGNRLRSSEAARTSGASGLEASALEEVLDHFEGRATKHSNIRRSYSAPRDPSLP